MTIKAGKWETEHDLRHNLHRIPNFLGAFYKHEADNSNDMETGQQTAHNLGLRPIMLRPLQYPRLVHARKGTPRWHLKVVYTAANLTDL